MCTRCGASSTPPQAAATTRRYLNGAGTGSVCFQCSSNSGTGGVSIGQRRRDAHHRVELRQQRQHLPTRTPRLLQRLNSGVALDCASTSACNIDSETPTANAHHIRLYNGAGTDIDSESTGGVTINNSTGGGTGPFTVYGGGATYYNTKLFQVQNNGNGTANYLLPSLAAGSGNYCLQADTSGYVTNTGQACGTGSGSGSVTSVGLSLPAQFSVANSPVTNSGTLTATWISQAGHSFLAGLDSSSTGTPTFRAIAADDVPTLNQSTSGNAGNLSGTPTLPNGTTATTQSVNDNSTKLATTGYVNSPGNINPATLTQTACATATTITTPCNLCMSNLQSPKVQQRVHSLPCGPQQQRESIQLPAIYSQLR